MVSLLDPCCNANRVIPVRDKHTDIGEYESQCFLVFDGITPRMDRTPSQRALEMFRRNH